MSDLRFSFPACVIAGKGEITPDDVGLMRRHLWPEGIDTRHKASMAIALDDVCSTRCPEWTAFLVESVAAFVVWKGSAAGEVSGETAGWLLERLSEGGAIRSEAGLDILLHVLELAGDVPDFLSAVALNQVRLALLPEPRGAYAARRRGGSRVTKTDLALIWRILRGAVDRGRLHLSRPERLVLAEIDRLGTPEQHHPGWREMVVLAQIASHGPTVEADAWVGLDDESGHRAA